MFSAFRDIVMLTQPMLTVCQISGRPWVHKNVMQRRCAQNSTSVHQPAEFHVDITESQLEDLNARLENTRWPDQLQMAADKGWMYGTELSYLQELAKYWETQYDWRAWESRLNQFSQYTLTDIEGLDQLHFVHQRSPRPDARPLIMIHGWPGSFFEFYKIIPMLTDPQDPAKPAFHIIAPSLPGFGFSSAPKQPGFGLKAMARVFHHLMLTLGYDRYFVQGGDWGAMISKALGVLYPQSCIALHLNSSFAVPDWYNPVHFLQYVNATYVPSMPLFLSKDEITAHQWVLNFFKTGNGYYAIQSTRPQTLAYAMNDSPVGLLAWIVEKFYFSADCGGDLDKSFSKDELLTNVALYWFTQRAPSSFRIYYEASSTGDFQALLKAYCPVPTGIAVFPKDFSAPESWTRPRYNLKCYVRMPSGGHFAALEKPKELASEVIDFFSAVARS